MAGIIGKAVRRLLPAGMAWRGNHLLIEGLDAALDRVRDYLRAIVSEARPGSADATIDEWINLLRLSVPVDLPLSGKQAAAAAEWAAIGGQSLEYVNAKIQAVFPDIYIEEVGGAEAGTAGVGEVGAAVTETTNEYTFNYYVYGVYPLYRDFSRLQGIIARIAPLHLVPIYSVTTTDRDVARANIAATGLARCGRTVSQA